jgi:hypothetical protein
LTYPEQTPDSLTQGHYPCSTVAGPRPAKTEASLFHAWSKNQAARV